MDIQIVKPSEFHKYKGELCLESEEKYKVFFAKYDCFSENAVIVIQPNKYIKKSNISNHTILKREPKSVKRYIMGILNIINSENYKKLLLKTKMYITIENIKEIFVEILDKCVGQIFFIQIYISLITDLMACFCENEKNIALNIINEFINKFMEKNYIVDQPQSPSYHDFCVSQKNKMIIISKNILIIELLTKTDYVQNYTINSYANILYDECIKIIDINNDIADVLLQMLIEICKTSKVWIDVEIIQQKNTKNNKTMFLVSDLLIHCK